jgi:hypothetical protein
MLEKTAEPRENKKHKKVCFMTYKAYHFSVSYCMVRSGPVGVTGVRQKRGITRRTMGLSMAMRICKGWALLLHAHNLDEVCLYGWDRDYGPL